MEFLRLDPEKTIFKTTGKKLDKLFDIVNYCIKQIKKEPIMDDRLLFLLSRAQHKFSNYLKKKFNEAGVHISPGQMGILFLLGQKNLRPMNELSKILDIDNSAITRLVDRLEKSGLAERTMNPSDRRQYLIGITAKGREQSEKAKHIAKQANEKIREGFTDEEIEVFKKVMGSFPEKFK